MVGVSAFGLRDSVAQAGAGCHQLAFYPTSAVLPTNPFGRILTGDEAYKERIQVGLPWPPEARIQVGEPVRRCPISIVWRALVEAGDRMVRWNAGQCGSFSLARILAKHVEGLLTGTLLADSCMTETTKNESSALAVAIPDHLDEFGQELLLRELASLGFRQSILVWRPVAAALSWLDKVEVHRLTKDMNDNDHIHVIYLGPDALEFTTFRLRVKEHNNQDYVLPLRDRPKDISPMTGVDWAGRLIEERFAEIDEGAFWQAFIQFPEVWQTLAGRPWKTDDLPRPWHRQSRWTLWKPDPNLSGYIYETKVSTCNTLRQILKKSLQLSAHLGGQYPSMREFFRSEVQRLSRLFPGGRLRGMIVCGSLRSNTIPLWLSSELNLLNERGLIIEGNCAEPQAGHLWISADCDDPIAQGAAIYGHRISSSIPSYLDTMPQLSILASERGRYTWEPLLKAQEVWGGEEYKDRIERRFQLDAGKRNLHVYLYRGPVDEAPVTPTDSLDPQKIPLKGVSPCRARIIQEIVRRLGSLEAVKNRFVFREAIEEAQYGRSFAEALFTSKGNEDTRNQEYSKSEIPHTPLRRAAFDFPSSPKRDTVLDIEVRIRPARGLARIEILPEETSFLQGDRVLLNYSSMRFASKLPKRMRGWPRIEEIIVDPKDSVLQSNTRLTTTFEKISPISQNYIDVINDIRDLVLKKTIFQNAAGIKLKFGTIDQNGQACTPSGNAIFQRIASKFESDLRHLQNNRRSALLKKVFSRAAWLYASTPANIVAHIKNILEAGHNAHGWGNAVEAAGRAFHVVEDFRLLFQSISLRAKSDPYEEISFPNNAARAICNILMLRMDGEKGLDRDMAQLFARRAVQRLQKEQEKKNFHMIYFQMIRLLLYLLRYRRSDPSCFDPNVPQSVIMFQEAKKSMEFAKNLLPKHTPKVGQIQKIIEGFDKYLHYEGTEEGIPELRDLTERD